MAISFAYQKDWLALRDPQPNTASEVHDVPGKGTDL
jgi:hypothetical protein